MGMQMEQNIFNQLAKEHHDEIMNFRRNRDREGLMKLQDELVDETKKRCKEQGYPKFTEEQQKAYTEVGGTPSSITNTPFSVKWRKDLTS